MTACEILLYLNTYYYPCEEPSVPVVTPPDYADIEDDWQDTGGNDTLPEEDFEIKPTDPIWWYHTDHLGSSTYLTNIFGRPSHYYETLPFGEMMVEHNQSLYTAGQYNNAYKFNGKELDEATQMYYYGARYYDPRFSIFVSVDPLVEVTFEPYSYVGNNPIMFTDPTGMSKDDIVFMGEGGAEVHRIKNDQVNKTFVVDVNAGSVATEGFTESGAQGWIEAKMPGTIPRKYDYNGGSSSTTASKYQQHDYLIAAETSYFNQYKNSGTVPTLNGKMMSGAGSKVPDLDPNVVKAISMIETNLGNIANRGLNNGSQDIMQANVYYSSTSHDWNSQKTQFGLTKGGGATPAQSVNAGIGLLFLKGLRDPSNINGSQVNKWFGGNDWGNAIRDYNGVSKIKPHFNLQGKVVYRNFVLQMAKEAK